MPSQTELLHDLGLEDQVCGITKFCVRPPEWYRSKPKIGGTKKIHLESVRALAPDLILANKEENEQEDIQLLAADYPVWVSDIGNRQQAIEMIRSVGNLTGTLRQATTLCTKIGMRFAALEQGVGQIHAEGNSPRTAYLIWKKPYMSVGRDTFIHDMMVTCGFKNLFEDRMRYPATSLQELGDRGCELVLLSSEPFPFSEKHIPELQEALPKARILWVDGEMFSWYGSRLLHAPAYFEDLIRGIRQ